MALAGMMLRRALLPLGSRAFRSPRILQSAAAICAITDMNILRRRKQMLTSDFSRVIGFLQIQQLSSMVIAEEASADENLIKVLEDKIVDKAQEAVAIPTPDWFPFEIQDDPGSWKVVLHRTSYATFQVVRIVADLTNPQNLILRNGDLLTFVAKATVTKQNGQLLEFDISVSFGGEYYFNRIGDSDSQLCLSGVSKKMDKAFYKYLEAKGIDPRTMSFLFNYMMEKEKRETLLLFNKVKNFVANPDT